MEASGTDQYADIKKLLDSSAVILAKILIKRDLGEEMPEAEWKEAIAEIKRLHQEVREKFSENRRPHQEVREKFSENRRPHQEVREKFSENRRCMAKQLFAGFLFGSLGALSASALFELLP